MQINYNFILNNINTHNEELNQLLQEDKQNQPPNITTNEKVTTLVSSVLQPTASKPTVSELLSKYKGSDLSKYQPTATDTTQQEVVEKIHSIQRDFEILKFLNTLEQATRKLLP